MIHRSRYPDVALPDQTLTEYVLGAAAARGDAPALIDGISGESVTYAQLVTRVGAAAAGLARAGIGSDDVVGLLGPNSVEWAIAYHAILAAGAVVTPLNPLLTPGESAKQLSDARACALVVSALVGEPGREAARLAGIERVWLLGGEPSFTDLEADGGNAPDTGAAPGDLALLPYSSGTTGISKGVMLTHRNAVSNMEQLRAVHSIDSGDVLVGVLPFFHIYGQAVVLNLGLARGAKIISLPRFDLDRFLALVAEHGVTRAHLAPPVILALATAPQVEDHDLSSLEIVISGAAPLDEELAARAGERIGCPVRQGYGMTEASPVTHFTSDEEAQGVPAGSVGFLVPNTEARLVAPGTEDDTLGEGELLIRGPQVMVGYLGNDEATRETITADGWLRTGDIARLEDGGVYRIVDRAKELIKYKGYQVAPAELEALLLTHPAVADVAVIPVPDREGGEAPKACVVAREEIDAGELMAWVAERVAPYKKIRAVAFVDEIPKSASGKILRRLLRD